MQNGPEEITLTDLPREIIQHLASYLNPSHLAQFRQTSRGLYQITAADYLWQPLLERLEKIDPAVIVAPGENESVNAMCVEQFNRISQAQMTEIAFMIKTLTERGHAPQLLSRLSLMSHNGAANTLSKLEKYDQQLTEINTALIKTEINPASDFLDLQDLGLTRFPEQLFEEEGLQTYSQQLTQLSISGNQIKRLPNSLSKCTALTTLFVYNNQLTSLEPLSNCTALKTLYADNNQLTSLEPLSQCTALMTLLVNYNQLTSLAPLSHCTALTELFVNNNQLTSLEPLSECTALRMLLVNNNQLTSLEPLSNCTTLTTLRAYNNEILSIPDFLEARLGQKWYQNTVRKQRVSSHPLPVQLNNKKKREKEKKQDLAQEKEDNPEKEQDKEAQEPATKKPKYCSIM